MSEWMDGKMVSKWRPKKYFPNILCTFFVGIFCWGINVVVVVLRSCLVVVDVKIPYVDFVEVVVVVSVWDSVWDFALTWKLKTFKTLKLGLTKKS
jgi:hypothetical protein